MRRLQSAGAILEELREGRVESIHDIYRGIRMRSWLEVAFARHLDGLGLTWTYEPHGFGAGRDRYLPDFRVEGLLGRRSYVEVKPTAAEVELAKSRIEVIWAAEPDAVLVVVCAEGCTFHVARGGETWWSFVERWRH